METLAKKTGIAGAIGGGLGGGIGGAMGLHPALTGLIAAILVLVALDIVDLNAESV